MKIYFIGIGGAGISALALMCKEKGYEVSGSDMKLSSMTDILKENGIKVFDQEIPENLTADLELIIYTAGIVGSGQALLEKAKEIGIQCEKREYLINQLVKDYISIGVAGTHGKTTTTSLLTHCLIKLDQDPSYLIGGILQTTDKNANLGKGKYFVWEADEFSNAFHGVHLNHAILNNVEYDHPDFFKTEQDYFNSFKFFLENNISEKIFINGDDKNIEAVISSSEKIKEERLIKFGSGSENNYVLDKEEIVYHGSEMFFTISNNDKNYPIETKLNGTHNLYNISAVFSILTELGFQANQIVKAIKSFEGSGRRFEQVYENEHVLVISDYAHHPTAIKTTIDGARSKGLPIVAVFEPHQYARITTLYEDFCNAFNQVDEVLILPIFVSRESAPPEDFVRQFVKDIKNPNASFIQNNQELINLIKNYKGEKKLFLCMSAGSLDQDLKKQLHDDE